MDPVTLGKCQLNIKKCDNQPWKKRSLLMKSMAAYGHWRTWCSLHVCFFPAGLGGSVSRAGFLCTLGHWGHCVHLSSHQASTESWGISTEAAVEALQFFLCLRFTVLLPDDDWGQAPSTASQQECQICSGAACLAWCLTTSSLSTSAGAFAQCPASQRGILGICPRWCRLARFTQLICTPWAEVLGKAHAAAPFFPGVLVVVVIPPGSS